MEFVSKEGLTPGKPAAVAVDQFNAMLRQAGEYGIPVDQSIVAGFQDAVRNRSKQGLVGYGKMLEGAFEKAAPMIEAKQKREQEVGNAISKLSALGTVAETRGVSIAPETISAIEKAVEDKDPVALATFSTIIEDRIKSTEKAQVAAGKDAVSPEKQLKANEALANMLIEKYNIANRVATDKDSPKVFGGTPAGRVWQEKVTGFGQSTRANLNRLKGTNLVAGMQDIKERTGTAAQMSERETSALQAAESELAIEQDWKDAQRTLKEYNAEILRKLKALGVSDQYLTQQGAESYIQSTEPVSLIGGAPQAAQPVQGQPTTQTQPQEPSVNPFETLKNRYQVR